MWPSRLNLRKQFGKELRYKMILSVSTKRNESKLNYSDGKNPLKMLVLVRIVHCVQVPYQNNATFDVKVTRNYFSYAIAMVVKNLPSRTE